MSTLKDRLLEVMGDLGWEHADVVRISRQSSSVVSQWLGKGSKPIRSIRAVEGAIHLERASGYSGIWIATGKLPKKVRKGWPFTFDRERFETLSLQEQGMVEHAARLEIERIEKERSSKGHQA